MTFENVEKFTSNVVEAVVAGVIKSTIPYSSASGISSADGSTGTTTKEDLESGSIVEAY